MSRPTLIPPDGSHACLYCAAWRSWDMQAVQREGSSIVERELTGQCRALPPSINRREIGSTNGEWPVVAASDWCLNFTLAPAAQTRAAPSSSKTRGRIE